MPASDCSDATTVQIGVLDTLRLADTMAGKLKAPWSPYAAAVVALCETATAGPIKDQWAWAPLGTQAGLRPDVLLSKAAASAPHARSCR